MSAPSHALHPDVAAAIAGISLAQPGDEGSEAGLGRFTVARTEALMRLREIPRGPWEWTVGLLQAALCLVRFARVQVSATVTDRERVVELHFSVPGARLEEALVGVGEVLFLGLEEAPSALREPTAEEGLGRWRVAIGAALNAGLAMAPTDLRLITPAGSRVLVRREGKVSPRHDPYRERRDPERCPRDAFIVRMREPRPSFGRRLASILALRGTIQDEIDVVWRRALLLWSDDDGDGLVGGLDLQRHLPGVRVRLGEHALWGMLPEVGGPWLVRDGVKVFDLSRMLAEHDLDARFFAGWIDCPSLRLTADLAAVTRDQAYELLVAWLSDAQAHAFPGNGGLPQIIWPTEAPHISTASGRPMPLAQVRQRAMEGVDFPYEWPHRRSEVPARAQARVFVVWPSQLALLTASIPELRPVPQRNLGDLMRQARADLGGLMERSLPVMPLELEAPTVPFAGEGGTLSDGTIRLEAYVHRRASATEGAIVILAHGRRIAQSREDSRNLPGVTLLATIEADVPIDVLRAERAALETVLERSRGALAEHRERLMAAAFAEDAPWEIPLVRASAATAGSETLGLTYRLQDGRMTLTWRERQLTGLSIGETRGGASRSLADALACLRDRGGVVVEHATQRWSSLDPEDAQSAVWSLSPHGLGLCERTLGERGLWRMPIAVEAQLRPKPATDQRRLLLTHNGRDDHLAKAARSVRSRAALVAHLLVARALGEPTLGLERESLFTRYDPRALSPSSLVSLEEIERSQPRPQLSPAGAVHRELAEVVIEATPGEAQLLHDVLELAPALPTGAGGRRSLAASQGRQAVRRRGHERSPLVTLPVVDEIAAGSLRIDDPDPDTPAAIALWAGGLHIDDLTLPAPLDCIGGRLWLTHAGLKAGTERLADRLRDLSRELLRRALDQRLYHPPESREALAVAALIARLQAAPARERTWISDLLPSASAGPRRQQVLARSLERHPLRRLIGSGSERLAQVLRQSLTCGVVLETAFLSWRAARILEAPAGRAGRWTLELGRRDAWVQAALARDATLSATFEAAAVVLATIYNRGRHEGLPGCDSLSESIAYYRLLALAFAHT